MLPHMAVRLLCRDNFRIIVFYDWCWLYAFNNGEACGHVCIRFHIIHSLGVQSPWHFWHTCCCGGHSFGAWQCPLQDTRRELSHFSPSLGRPLPVHFSFGARFFVPAVDDGDDDDDDDEKCTRPSDAEWSELGRLWVGTPPVHRTSTKK